MNRQALLSSGNPAPYGHACTGCAQSKCKCILRQAGGPCERCHRLNKECRPSETTRRRNSKKSVVSKTVGIKENFDGLASIVKNGAKFDFTGASFEPSPIDAENYLANFQTYKSKFFPFVYIPSTTTAQQLRHERPFLWLCIMTVGSKSTSQQQVLGSKIRQTVAQEMVIYSAKRFDILLGLLAFIGWSNYQISSNPFLSLFTQLAVSLVFDLGLNKPVPKEPQDMLCVNPKCLRPTTPRTMEERRAVLGCFLITSIISSSLQRTDALRWTPHMDECLLVLDERKECPNDDILVQQVRLQLIVEKMALGASHDGTAESTEHREPTTLYLEKVQSQLHGIKTVLLSEAHTNEVVLLHVYSTELETALSPTFLHTNQLTHQQWKLLGAGLESIKSWFNVFFTIAPATYIGFPFSIFTQLARCLMTLYRLTSLDDLTWDENGILKSVDPLLVLDRVINNMEQVKLLAGLDNNDSPEGDIFHRTAQMLRSLRTGWESKFRRDDLLLSDINIPPNLSEIFLSDSIGLETFDGDWLLDLLPPAH